MEFRQLQYFLLVAQELSFVKAAKQSYVSQQALSKSVLALENELGIQLFERLPHGLSLTSYGKVLVNNANHIIANVNNLKNDIQNMRSNQSNIISIAITSGVENSLDVKYLKEFEDLYPKYKLSTIDSNDLNIEKWLLSEKIELALMGAQWNLSKLNYVCLQECATILAVNKNNPISNKATVKLEDLSNEVFLFGANVYYAHNRLLLLCNFLGFSPQLRHTTENILFISDLVAYNMGIFLCPDNSVQYFKHPDINLIPFEEDPKIFGNYLVTKKNQSLSEGAKLFKSFILDKSIK